MSRASLTRIGNHEFEKLSRTSEKLSRRLVYGLKFAVVFGLFVSVAYRDRKAWDHMNGNPDLQAWPYDEDGDIGRSFWWGFLSATIISAWSLTSLAVIYRSSRHHDRWLHVWGAVDLALACFACYTLNLHSKYIPHRLGQCKGTRPENWHIVDNYPSIFQKIASTWGESTSAKEICQSFAGLWIMSVTGIFFQFLVAYIGIFSHSEPRSILNPWRPVWHLLCLILCPFCFLAVLFVDSGLPLIRLGGPSVWRCGYILRRSHNANLAELAPYTPSNRSFNNPESKLIDILLIEHLLLNIVGNLHHDDLVNLSSTCRSAREAIYPRHDLIMRIPKLMRRCCLSTLRERCYYCNKLICRQCKRDIWPIHRRKFFSGHFHTTECAPYCRKCYVASFCNRPRDYKPPCNGEMWLSYRVCPSCAGKDSLYIFKQRQHRFAQEAIAIAQGKVSVKRVGPSPGADVLEQHSERFTYEGNVKTLLSIDGRHCGKCNVELKSGMRWWVCGVCKGECRNPIHPPFVRQRDMWNPDVEMAGTPGNLEVSESVPWWQRLWRRLY